MGGKIQYILVSKSVTTLIHCGHHCMFPVRVQYQAKPQRDMLTVPGNKKQIFFSKFNSMFLRIRKNLFKHKRIPPTPIRYSLSNSSSFTFQYRYVVGSLLAIFATYI